MPWLPKCNRKVAMLTCDLCGAEFETPDGIPRTFIGRVFCTETHEKKYIELYDRWLAAAYHKKTPINFHVNSPQPLF